MKGLARRRVVGLLLLGLALPACGELMQPSTYPVSGTVTYNGDPLREGVITFHPDNGRAAYGRIKNGHIVDVTTFREGDGALPGHHRVVIEASTEDPNDPFNSFSMLPIEYASPGTSGLEAELTSARGNTLSFELTDREQ
ncbi:hypothetical protein Pan216_02630 [Planctomycetes bacterium Pan216]|uniref:Carboxypeptidase regulatory-like domain-containing protein n=1 Tax=Kolteria novifilia TaxID=2527975 RepID=A0A518AXH8_9BACT|nr:hypothetical protein Pan216_02630 [Planctomycetes bacterium Pan216]